MSDQKCPCCGRPLRSVFDRALDGVMLPRIERRIIDALAEVYPDGLTSKELVEVVYGDDPNGGPVTARNCINVRLNAVRKRIREIGWTVGAVKRGASGVRLEQIGQYKMVKKSLTSPAETLSA